MTKPKGKTRSRQKILAAAAEAFAALGYDQTGMEEIARRAGLTRMTVYNLFPSKEQIALALAAARDAQLASQRQALINSGRSATQLLDENLSEAARWCLANPSLARVVLTSKIGLGAYEPPEGPSFHRFICDIVALGQRQGEMRGDYPPFFFAGVLLGAFTLTMLTALAGAPFEEVWIGELVRCLLDGFGPRQPRIFPETESDT